MKKILMIPIIAMVLSACGTASAPAPTESRWEISVQPDLAGNGECLFDFIGETIPDRTIMQPGQTFTKTWIVKNTGPCDWDAAYILTNINTYSFNDRVQCETDVSLLGTPEQMENPVPAGEQVELKVDFVAPKEPGQYTSCWLLLDSTGKYLSGSYLYTTILVE